MNELQQLSEMLDRHNRELETLKCEDTIINISIMQTQAAITKIDVDKMIQIKSQLEILNK